MNQQLKFSTNFNNKLDCTFFTTIRSFQLNRDKDVDIILNSVHYKTCNVWDVWDVNFSKLSEELLSLDTGLPYPESKALLHRFGMVENQTVYVYLLKTVL